jgi:hypothetical protein
MITAELIRRILPYVIAVALVLGALFGAYSHGVGVTDATWQAKWDRQAATLADEKAQAERKERDKEQRHQAAIDEVRNDARKEIDRMAATAAAAADAADGLREQARRLAARGHQACRGAGVAGGGAPEASPAMVLAELLDRVEAEGRRMARLADESRAAGLACERAYEAVRAQ